MKPYTKKWWDEMLMESNWRQEIAMYNQNNDDKKRYGVLFEWIEERINQKYDEPNT